MTTKYSESLSDTRMVRVREVADSIQYGHTASAVSREDGPRFLRITDIQNGAVDWDSVPSCEIASEDLPKYRLSEGDLVFARTGATTGKSFLIQKCPAAVFASYLIRVRASKDVDPRYLAFFFQSPDYWRQIEQGKRGIGQPNVNGRTLGEVKLPLRPLDEQQRIVAEIEKRFTRLDAGVASLKRVQTALKRYRASVLKAACEGRLVPTEAELARKENRSFETGEQLLQRIFKERRERWNRKGKYKEPASPNSADLPELPDGWTWTTVEQVSTKVVDGTHHTPSYFSEGIPFISVKDVHDGKVHFDDCKYISEKAHDELIRRCHPEKGDVLITKSGTIGRTATVNTDRPFSLFVSVALVKPVRSVTTSKFIEVALQRYIATINVAQDIKGGLLKNLHLEDLRIVALPLPPFTEQARIVGEVERRLWAIEGLEAITSTELQRAIRLRQAILQAAFSERLT